MKKLDTCPKCGAKINAAKLFSMRAAGKKRKYSDEEILKRTERIKEASKKRWAKPRS